MQATIVLVSCISEIPRSILHGFEKRTAQFQQRQVLFEAWQGTDCPTFKLKLFIHFFYPQKELIWTCCSSSSSCYCCAQLLWWDPVDHSTHRWNTKLTAQPTWSQKHQITRLDLICMSYCWWYMLLTFFCKVYVTLWHILDHCSVQNVCRLQAFRIYPPGVKEPEQVEEVPKEVQEASKTTSPLKTTVSTGTSYLIDGLKHAVFSNRFGMIATLTYFDYYVSNFVKPPISLWLVVCIRFWCPTNPSMIWKPVEALHMRFLMRLRECDRRSLGQAIISLCVCPGKYHPETLSRNPKPTAG